MTELKPCPFCGGEPYNVPQTCSYSAIGQQHFYRVLCKNCAADTPPQSTPDAAIVFWNTRATPRTDGDDGELVELLLGLAAKFEGQGGKHYSAALFSECAARITALSAEVERLTASAKNNNQLARMYKAQADEFRAKYVAAVGQD